MRTIQFTFCFILVCISGCSQSGTHGFNQSGKIPIDPKRWYQLNNIGIEITQLFDTQLNQHLSTGKGKLLEEFEIWYPLLDGEQMVIDSIEMFDWEGTTEQRPTAIYAILNNWQKVTLGNFISTKAKKWVGPYPAELDVFALKTPVSGIRYLIIDTWGNLPTEIEFYGQYTPPKSQPQITTLHYTLKNYCGINGFEWDFENPKEPSVLDPTRLSAIKGFSGWRHYLDWEKIETKEGSYAFNPSKNGGWNYDTIYHWCKENNIDVLVCLKNNPPWLLETYPQDQREAENTPIAFNTDIADPKSYLAQAKAAFQFAARYGGTQIQNIAISNSDSSKANSHGMLIKVDTVPRWPNDIVNTIKSGLGFIKYMECSNETDKWWKGRKAYQSGREYAANLSAFYDGDKNTMGPGVGVKNADPSMKVVMAGVATPTTDYLKGMIDWSKEHRGYKPNGQPDLPWDIINYHYYSCEYSPNVKKHTNLETGVAPELSNTETIAKDFMQTAQIYANGMPVWVTEAGYDLHPNSTQRAIPIGKKPALLTQADWVLRTSLLYSRMGIAKLFFYELYDDNGTNIKYGTSGLLNANKTRRPAADYLYQTQKLFGAYSFVSQISNAPEVDMYQNKDTIMYVIFNPTQEGKESNYNLDLKNATSAYIYIPKPESDNMEMHQEKTTNGKLGLIATETPMFVTNYPIAVK